ncbi:MAG: hypothetical protein NC489_43745, partial [Ruminococcus flavefaciens]|nr:hypothetical protein [Ruminococcus flavefaciens]
MKLDRGGEDGLPGVSVLPVKLLYALRDFPRRLNSLSQLCFFFLKPCVCVVKYRNSGANENLSSEFSRTSARKDKWKFAHSDRQDFGTSGNFSPEANGTHEQAEISFPESVGTLTQAEIPPRQPIEPADFKNAYGFQSQQNAETHRNAAPRTRRNDTADSNSASEKRDDTREGFHDIIEGKGSANREMKTTPLSAQTEEETRLERMNAAYERDRAALA